MFTKKSITILILVLSAFSLYIYRESVANYLTIITDQEAVSSYLQSFGALGPVVLFCLLVAQVFIAVIPGHALMVTAGYAYGTLGLIVVAASTIVGSQLAFSVARKYGRNLIYKLASPEIINKWDKTAKHQGVIFYFFSFVLPIFPSDLMCYVAGLATISPRKFFVANVLGRTCCAVLFTMIGIYGMNPPVWFWIALVVVAVGLFIGWRIYKKTNSLQIEATAN